MCSALRCGMVHELWPLSDSPTAMLGVRGNTQTCTACCCLQAAQNICKEGLHEMLLRPRRQPPSNPTWGSQAVHAAAWCRR